MLKICPMPTASMAALPLTLAQRKLLDTYHFDAESFLMLKRELQEGRFPAERNEAHEQLTPPALTDFVPWPGPISSERMALLAEGERAIAEGEVCVAVLNGGMATRFGGVVKGVVVVEDNKSFLQLKLEHVAKVGAGVPVFLMNSFATHEATGKHLQECLGTRAKNVHSVCQSISMRLDPKGELFVDKAGEPSFYAPGHGDLLRALAHSEAFQTFVKNGGKYVAVSNVDNLAATLSPIVIGAHIRGQKPVTVEVAPRQAQDAGGAPVRRNGHLEVLEGFRYPKSFDMASLPVFNTNSFVLSHTAVRDDYPLTWFRADKKVDGAPVVQFERLVGEITAFCPSTYLMVPRQGPECRFLPVKSPPDLPNILPWVRAHL